MSKGLVVAGAILFPVGFLTTAFLWQDYWLRASSPNNATAAISVAIPALTAFAGILAFLAGAIGLAKVGSSRRHVVLGFLIGLVTFVLLFLFYSVPLATSL